MSESTPDHRSEQAEPERPNPSPAGDRTASAAEGDTAPTEQQPAHGSAATGTTGGSASPTDGEGITDDQLPEDLQPTDDNPLAQPPGEDDEDSGMSLGPDGPQP